MHSCLVRVYLYVFLGQMRTPDGKECTELPDGAPDQDCRFFDSDDESESYEGSLMYKQFLPEVSRLTFSANKLKQLSFICGHLIILISNGSMTINYYSILIQPINPINQTFQAKYMRIRKSIIKRYEIGIN